MKTESDWLFPIILCSVLGVFGLTVYVHVAAYQSGMEKVQKQAIHYEYGSLSKDGYFIWKEEQLKDNFLKDLEFFKRNGTPPTVEMPRFDPSKPF